MLHLRITYKVSFASGLSNSPTWLGDLRSTSIISRIILRLCSEFTAKSTIDSPNGDLYCFQKTRKLARNLRGLSFSHRQHSSSTHSPEGEAGKPIFLAWPQNPRRSQRLVIVSFPIMKRMFCWTDKRSLSRTSGRNPSRKRSNK